MANYKIENVNFEDSAFRRGDKLWNATSLYDFAKMKGYPVLDCPLWALDLSEKVFKLDNTSDFIAQMKRVKKCSLKYPIILDDMGQVADGNHRVCKAMLLGLDTIKAIRLLEMPPADEIINE